MTNITVSTSVSHRGFHCSNQSSKNRLRETLMPGRTPDYTKENISKAQDHYTSGFHQTFFICDVFKVKTPPDRIITIVEAK